MAEKENAFVPSRNFQYIIPREKLQEMKQAFDAYDIDGDGVISMEVTPVALRAIGVLISNKELDELIRDLEGIRPGEVDLSTFFVVAARKLRDAENIEDHVNASFRKICISNLDFAGRSAPLNVFRVAVSAKGGEQLTEAEMDLVTKELFAAKLVDLDGHVDVDGVINLMNTPLQTMVNKRESNSTEEMDEEASPNSHRSD